MRNTFIQTLRYSYSYYAPDLGIFRQVDPMVHKYPWLSTYSYCAADPINAIDPDGRSTDVIFNGKDTYKVIDGDVYDDDLNIYLCILYKGLHIRIKSIGYTPVTTSFYNSDMGAWMPAIIDTNDQSGINFINNIVQYTPSNFFYAVNALPGKLFDFKASNGTSTIVDDSEDCYYHYRGMPIPITIKDKLVYSSARDIGNIVAGYVTGYNGLPWEIIRLGFDALQSFQEKEITTEGISSQNAQRFGFYWGREDLKKERNFSLNKLMYNFFMSVSNFK